MPDPANPMGGIINSLPIGTMVAAPVMAAVDAQFAIAARTAEFIEKVGLNKDGSVKMVRASFKHAVLNENGEATGQIVERVIDVPFISTVPLPNLQVARAKVNFDLEVSTAEQSTSASEYQASLSGSVGFAWWKVSFSGSVTHKSEQTRKTDTRAKYSFEVEVGPGEKPEGFARMMDAIMQATTKPILKEKAPALAQDSGKNAA